MLDYLWIPDLFDFFGGGVMVDGGWWDLLRCSVRCRLGDGKKFQKYSIYYNNILHTRVPKNTPTIAAAKKKNGKKGKKKKVLLLLLQKLSSHGQ